MTNKKLLWGDIHNHCGITYGFGDLNHALERAKSHLDFVAITGHAMWPDMYDRNEETAFIVDFHRDGFKKLLDHWKEIRDTIAKSNSEDLVTFQAYEMHSSKYGDHHIVSPDDTLPLIYRDSPAELVRDCGCRAIVVPHHIGYTPNYRGINWDYFQPENSPVLEVCSKHGCAMSETSAYPYYHDMGPKDSHNTVYEGLKRGYHFGFVGSTDHHAGYPGSYGDGKLAVWADAKNRESIWEAINSRRTYAVTGDRILCEFFVNGKSMGSEVSDIGERTIALKVEAGYALEKITVYKNLKPIKIINGELLENNADHQRYKLRIEMGWSNKQELYKWVGSVKVEDAKILDVEPCFRGKSILAPKADETFDTKEINNIDNRILSVEENSASWQCFTIKNTSPQHPNTSAVIVEFYGNRKSKVTINVNGHEQTKTVAELLDYGYSEHMRPFHSHAYKVHSLLPEAQFAVEDTFVDNVKENECDVYHMEVAQKNSQWAYVSPIFVK